MGIFIEIDPNATETYVDNAITSVSGVLQDGIDSMPDTFLELEDTPNSYENAQYLQSTTSGTFWSFISGIPGPKGDDGGEWMSGPGLPATTTGTIGNFYLDTDTGDVYKKVSVTVSGIQYNVMVEREADYSYTFADAIRLVKTGQELIVDNEDEESYSTGSWFNFSNGNAWDGTCKYATTSYGAKTYWNIIVPENGEYDIYAWWPIYANSARNAPFTITHMTGTNTVRKDQHVGSPQWNYLATHSFDGEPVWEWQMNIHGVDRPTTFSGLTDTPNIYEVGKFLKATASGIMWTALSDHLENYVTTNTDQTISGTKTFDEGKDIRLVSEIGYRSQVNFIRTNESLAGEIYYDPSSTPGVTGLYVSTAVGDIHLNANSGSGKVYINGDVLPVLDDIFDLGSSTYNWKYLHVETIRGNPNDNLYISTSNNRQIRLYSDRDIINMLGDHSGATFWHIENDVDGVQVRIYSDGVSVFGAENPYGSEQFRFIGDMRIEGDLTLAGTGNLYAENLYGDGSNITGFTLDDAYNNDSGERTIVVDSGSVSWDLIGSNAFIVDVQGTGYFEVQNVSVPVFRIDASGFTSMVAFRVYSPLLQYIEMDHNNTYGYITTSVGDIKLNPGNNVDILSNVLVSGTLTLDKLSSDPVTLVEGEIWYRNNNNFKVETNNLTHEIQLVQIIQCYNTTVQNLNQTTPQAIQWNNEDFKDALFTHSNVTNNSRIQINYDGVYEINYNVSMDNTTNSRATVRTRARINGTTYINIGTAMSYSRNTTDDKQSNTSGPFVLQLTNGDYIEIMGDRQGSSGTVNTISNESHIYIKLLRYV